jgi:hypothetical protein
VKISPTFHPTFADMDVFIGKLVILRKWVEEDNVFFVAHPKQMHMVGRLKELVNANRFRLCINPLREGENNTQWLANSQEEIERLRRITDAASRDFEYLSKSSSPKGKLCRAGWRYAIIRPSGQVFKCNREYDNPIGNILDEGFSLSEKPCLCEFDFCPCEFQNLI